MRKALLLVIVFSILAATGTVYAQTGNLGAFDLVLKAEGRGAQELIANSNLLPRGARFMKGETYELDVSFTVSRDCADFNFALIDNTEAANWWRNLSNWPSLTDVKAGQVYNEKLTLILDQNATGNSTAANKICVQTNSPGGNVTVKFTRFVLTKK